MHAQWSSKRCSAAGPRLSQPGPVARVHAPPVAAVHCKRSRRRPAVVASAKPNLYDVLGVAPTATDREIKKAYRQKALKLHPDVNKEADAEARFMEAKNAFAILSDAKERAEYDRRLRQGSFSGWGDFSSGGWGSATSTAGAGARRPQQQQEEFYGLDDILRDAGSKVTDFIQKTDWGQLSREVPSGVADWVQQQGERLRTKGVADFFKDLDKELDDWTKSREKAGKPLDLWSELSGIGEELVDYLEDTLGIPKEGGGSSSSSAKKDGSSSTSTSTSSSSGRPKSALDEYEQILSTLGMDGKAGSNSSSSSSKSSSGAASSSSSSGANAGGSSSSSSTKAGSSRSSSSQGAPGQAAPKSADEEIDDMLAALKKKLNKP